MRALTLLETVFADDPKKELPAVLIRLISIPVDEDKEKM
jgi:hypothetical protein